MIQPKNASFDLRRSQSIDPSRFTIESVRYEPNLKDKIITHLPYELMSIFLLSQNNNNSILNFYSFGKDHSIPIKNVEKSGKSLAELLHGINENQNIIRRELRMLSGEYISADGLPLPKSAIETLVKVYDIYYQKCKNRNKEKTSLRDLIDQIHSYSYISKSNGEEKVRILVQILLLSTVSISSHRYENSLKKDILSREKIFKISSDNFTNNSEIIRLLADKANEKTEKNNKDGGKKTGRIMDACREIYIDFRASAFEKLAIKHNKIIDGKLKAKGQFFKYNLGFNNADARLCAILDLLKPYNLELNSDGSAGKRVEDKTFSLKCIAELMGITSQLKERKDRFHASLTNAASVFGEIHANKSNIRILFGKWASVGLVGSPPDNQSDLSEKSVGLVGSPPDNQSDLSEKSVGLVGNEGKDLSDSKIKPLLVDQVDLNTISITSNGFEKKDLEQNDEDALSSDVSDFINSMKPYAKRVEKAKAKAMGIVKYEKELRQTKGFFNYLRKSTKENAHAS